MTTININEYTFDLMSVEDTYGPHLVYQGPFLINPYSELVILYKGKSIVVDKQFVRLQQSRAGDNCIYLVLAQDLRLAIRGIHRITPEFIEMVPNELKKGIINKHGWFACSLCEVIEGESIGEFTEEN